jgi:hypothetical protein
MIRIRSSYVRKQIFLLMLKLLSFMQGFESAQNDPMGTIMVQRAMESCPFKTVLALGAGNSYGVVAITIICY